MKKGTLLVISAFLLLSGTSANEGTVYIHNGFGTGQGYLGLSDAAKAAYAMGEMNGYLMAPLFGAPENGVDWVVSCIKEMNNVQLSAILTKHIKDNPQKWHHSLNFLTFEAMRNVCKESP